MTETPTKAGNPGSPRRGVAPAGESSSSNTGRAPEAGSAEHEVTPHVGAGDAPRANVVITEPGVYYDLPAADYHAQHDWLSWSRMKYLVPPSTPAHFKASLTAGEERKRHFDMGKVVHALVLGDGKEFEVVQALNKAKETVDATSYDLVSAQRHRDEIYAAGKVPILRFELDVAEKMAASVKAHRIANALLSNGKPEVSLFWVDEATGVKCRARVDWLPDKVEGRRLIVPDVKTAVSAAPVEFAKAVANWGYFGQWTHYLDGIRALGLDDDPAWVFVTIEKSDPFLVSVSNFAQEEDVKLARGVVDHCRRLYRECSEADHWPGYSEGIQQLSLPSWLHFQLEGLLE